MNHRIESVQVLRGIAALFVVCQHICFLQRGSFGVDLFFIISGFVVMIATEKSTEHFLGKRALRILPLYFGMTLFSYAVLLVKPDLFASTKAEPVFLIKSLLFIPFSQDGATQPLLRVGWTINYEMQFYVLFWIAMRISKRFRALICAGMLGILVLIGALISGLPEPFSFWTDSILLEFAFGMGLFYAVRRVFGALCGGKAQAEGAGRENVQAPLQDKSGVLRRRAVWYAIPIVIGAAVFFYEWRSYEIPALCSLPQFVRWGLPSAGLFFVSACAGMCIRMPRILVRLGDMSFSLYLLHYYPIQMLNRLIHRTTAPDAGEICLTIAVFAAVLFASWLCYVLAEKKLTDCLRRKLLPEREVRE